MHRLECYMDTSVSEGYYATYPATACIVRNNFTNYTLTYVVIKYTYNVSLSAYYFPLLQKMSSQLYMHASVTEKLA